MPTTEDFITQPTDTTNVGKKFRLLKDQISGQDRWSRSVYLVDGENRLAVDASGKIGIFGTVPISGALTDAELRATPLEVVVNSLPAGLATDAGLAAIVSALSSAVPPGDNNIGNVDVLTLPALPVGDNNIGNVDVVSLPALPAGNNNIGDVDVVSLPVLTAGDNNIGNVDIASMPNVTIAALPALPAGGNLIGHVVVDSVAAIAAGDNNIGNVDVVSLPALPAGGNVIGHVVVDTLPALPAGGNVIGHVIVDTIPNVTIGAAIPAGTNVIGHVIVDTIPNVTVVAVPVDPFGANADAASAAGSISAKLKYVANGIAGMTVLPAGDNNIGNIDVVTLPALPAGNNNIGDVDVVSLPALPAGNNNIGDVDIASMPNVTIAALPADPFGLNADVASATGSISAKIRFLAGGIAGMSSLPTGANNIGKVDINSHPAIAVGANEIGKVSLAYATGKSVVGVTGNLVTTAVTADQVIVTYTVTAGKTLYLQAFNAMVRLTTYAATATNFGNFSLQIGGVVKYTMMNAHAGIINPQGNKFSEPIPIAAGTVVRIVCTPAATTSFTWQGNLSGYEI